VDVRETTLAILAGGESSRMGISKAAMEIDRKPVLSWLLDQIKWTGPTLLVTAPGREHPPGADRFDCEACDPTAGLGPLRGILTAVEKAGTEHLVVATVDMPWIRLEHLDWVVEQLLRVPESRGVMMQRGFGTQRLIEPFPSAYRRSAAAEIAMQLRRQRRAAHALLQIAGFTVVDAPREWPARTWFNLNTRTEVAEFLRSWDEDPAN
jgi:molybdenum cofactor guanylyltransferase